MLIDILIFVLATAGFISLISLVYYHFEYKKASRAEIFVSGYNLELLDQKKVAAQMIAILTLSSAMILAILKQHYTGG